MRWFTGGERDAPTLLECLALRGERGVHEQLDVLLDAQMQRYVVLRLYLKVET